MANLRPGLTLYPGWTALASLLLPRREGYVSMFTASHRSKPPGKNKIWTFTLSLQASQSLLGVVAEQGH